MFKKGMALFICIFLWISPVFAAETSDSWNGESVYSLEVNNFNNGKQTNDQGVKIHQPNAYHGGDIDGIRKQLDYIKDMGFTVISVSSIFQRGTKIDEHYGSISDVKQLIKAAHRKQLKVVFQMDSVETQLEREQWLQTVNADGYYLDDGYYLLQGNKLRKLALQQGYYEEITKTFAGPNVSLRTLYELRLTQNSGVFLDNENTKRFTRVALENKQYPPTRLKLALTYLFTSPGVPMMYYGTDIALDGGNPPDNRGMMNFEGNEDFLAYISQLGKLRQQFPSLQYGDSQLLYEKDGMAIIKRAYQNETLLIAINNTSEDHHIHLSNKQIAGGKELHGMLEDDLVRGHKDGYDIISERETANIYVLQDRTGINYTFLIVVGGGWIVFAIFFRYLKKIR